MTRENVTFDQRVTEESIQRSRLLDWVGEETITAM